MVARPVAQVDRATAGARDPETEAVGEAITSKEVNSSIDVQLSSKRLPAPKESHGVRQAGLRQAGGDTTELCSVKWQNGL